MLHHALHKRSITPFLCAPLIPAHILHHSLHTCSFTPCLCALLIAPLCVPLLFYICALSFPARAPSLSSCAPFLLAHMLHCSLPVSSTTPCMSAPSLPAHALLFPVLLHHSLPVLHWFLHVSSGLDAPSHTAKCPIASCMCLYYSLDKYHRSLPVHFNYREYHQEEAVFALTSIR